MKNLRLALIFAAAGLICLALVLCRPLFSEPAKHAVLRQNGEVIKTIDLENVPEPYEFTVKSGEGFNTIRVEKGRIAVISADCPDKICVKQGFISDDSLPVVCLPHRLSIEIKS